MEYVLYKLSHILMMLYGDLLSHILLLLLPPVFSYIIKRTPSILTGLISGMIFCKDKIINKVRNITDINQIARIAIVFPLAALIEHAIVQSLFVAPFTAMIALTSLFAAKLPYSIENCLHFLGNHSSNIWSIHMFSI